MIDFHPLSTQVTGRVILPNDAEYEQLRQVFPGGVDRKPAAIVRVKSAADIQKTIAFARENQVELTVRSGGHSAGVYGVVDGALVIDLRDLKAITIDPAAKTVWAEAGLTAGEVTQAADAHDLAIGFGDTGSVGIGGITLGGGVGFLVRKFGLAIDNLLAAEIVTADGQILMVNEDAHPDLFWAIRGGGGNFGVVTKFQFRLHDLTDVLGGMMILPASAEIMTKALNVFETGPEELSGIINIMPTPPMPFVDAKHHGQLSLMILLTYAGDPSTGEKVIAPLRNLATPLADMVKPMRYHEMFHPDDPSYRPKAVAQNLHLKHVDQVLAEKILAHLQASNAPMRVLQLRVLGGAMSRVAPEATAYAHRTSPIMANIAAFYETEEEKHQRTDWLEAFAKLLDQGEKGLYVNFVGTNQEDRLTDVYPPATLERLKTVKQKYDPTNLFHHNLNIKV